MSMREILDQALMCTYGLEVEVNSPDIFKRQFYTERRKAKAEGFLDYEGLGLKTCPTDPDGKIWVINKEQPDGPSQE